MITVIANLKGGTGKSTVTFNLAVWLCSMNREVTVIDLDPQRTLSDVVGVREEEGIEPVVRLESGPFSEVRLPESADDIVIDVGTADLGSFKQAIMIADRIVIPVTPSQADIWSTQRFVRFLYKNTHGNPPETIAFLNRADANNRATQACDEAAAALHALPGVRLIQQRLSDRAVYRDSFSEGLSVFELEPRSVASREFKALAETLFGRGYRSVIGRLRKQMTASADDVSIHRELAVPAAERGAGEYPATDRHGFASFPGGDAQANPQEASKKKRKGGKGKKSKRDKHGGKGKKGKKHKKGKKGKKG